MTKHIITTETQRIKTIICDKLIQEVIPYVLKLKQTEITIERPARRLINADLDLDESSFMFNKGNLVILDFSLSDDTPFIKSHRYKVLDKEYHSTFHPGEGNHVHFIDYEYQLSQNWFRELEAFEVAAMEFDLI